MRPNIKIKDDKIKMRTILKKVISCILTTSLLIVSTCSYVQARDIELSIIYMLDAVEDLEYKERENAYREEHLSFLELDESTNGDQGLAELAHISVGASTTSPQPVGAVSHASPSEVDVIEEESEYEEEPENATTEINAYVEPIESEKTVSETVDIGENEATQSEIEEEVVSEVLEELSIATESEVSDIRIASLSDTKEVSLVGDSLYGTSPTTELFTLPISSSTFSVKAITKKSPRGGQTCIGVLVCGSMQTSSLTTNQYMGYECNHPEWHKAEFKLYKEVPDSENPGDTEDIYANVSLECSPESSIIYPNYSAYGEYTEEKQYNLQSELIRVNTGLQLDTYYHITELASGCTIGDSEEIEVSEGYVLPPLPIRQKHEGPHVKDHLMEDNIDDSLFVLYKVKYGDNFERIAAYYGYDDVEELAKDNHMVRNGASQKYMCYEGDILFIRDPDYKVIDKPFENNLTPLQLAAFKALDFLLGYDAALCAFYGEPINMSTGDFYLEHTDFELPELNKTFKFSRSYNSIGSIIRSNFESQYLA